MGSKKDKKGDMILSENLPAFFTSKTIGDFLREIGSEEHEFGEAIQMFLSNKYLTWIQDKFIDESNVKHMFSLLTELSAQFSIKFSKDREIVLSTDEKITEEQALNKVRELLKLLQAKFTIEEVIAEGFEENSRDYNALKDQIDLANEIIIILFNRTYTRILNVKSAQKGWDDLHRKKIDLIQAIGNAGGDTSITASNTEIAETLSAINKQESFYHQIVNNPDFQPRTDPFARNKRKTKNQEDL